MKHEVINGNWRPGGDVMEWRPIRSVYHLMSDEIGYCDITHRSKTWRTATLLCEWNVVVRCNFFAHNILFNIFSIFQLQVYSPQLHHHDVKLLHGANRLGISFDSANQFGWWYHGCDGILCIHAALSLKSNTSLSYFYSELALNDFVPWAILWSNPRTPPICLLNPPSPPSSAHTPRLIVIWQTLKALIFNQKPTQTKIT